MCWVVALIKKSGGSLLTFVDNEQKRGEDPLDSEERRRRIWQKKQRFSNPINCRSRIFFCPLAFNLLLRQTVNALNGSRDM